MCIEKVVIRKSGEELYSKTYQSPTLPQRIVLKPNLHYERQDTTRSDARTSFDPSSKHNKDCDGGTYNESCRGEIDFRIQGLPHSAVQEHDNIRKKAVQKLIHQFETHPKKEALQADLKQNCAFNPFSEHSKEMIYSMGNTEHFEICETTLKIQCPKCMTNHSPGNTFERFREVLELISRFEFDFRRREIFLIDSNFWCVQSSITCSESVHVHVLWSVSTHTIPFRIVWRP